MSNRTDKLILARIRKNDITAWEDLYEIYSPIMLGAINVFTRDQILAEKLLIDTWLVLRDQNTLGKTNIKLPLYLYIFTFRYTLLKLKAQGINPCVEDLENYPQIIQQLCKKYGVMEKPVSEVYTNKDLRIQKNTYCWLPVLGINLYAGQVRSRIVTR
ncbi:MAG: hypothetical protein ABIN74_15385 [Ferruginibacter sp.]